MLFHTQHPQCWVFYWVERLSDRMYCSLFRPTGILTLLLMMAGTPAVLTAQTSGVLRPEISRVLITVDDGFTVDQIDQQIITKSSPWAPMIFLNEKISSNFGAPRRLYDPMIFYNDIVHLYDYFQDLGYFKAVIDTGTTIVGDQNEIEISIAITVGERSMIDTVRLEGLPVDDEVLTAAVGREPLLAAGDPFVKRRIFDEQTRILQILNGHGYPLAAVDSVSMKRYASTNNVSVFIQFKPNDRYVFGETDIRNTGSDIEIDIVTNQIDYRAGDTYDERRRVSSEQNLNRLGLFENVNLRSHFTVDSAGAAVSNMVLMFRTLEFQEVTPEFLVLSENNELFSTGLGLGYKHRNFFGGARNFSVTARGRLNRLEELNFPRVLENGLSEPTLFSKADIQSQLVFPYFYSNKTSASITLTGEAEKQKNYRLNTLRAKVAFTTKFATFTTGITEFNVERVDPQFEVAGDVRPEDSTKQFNFIEAFTLQRNKTNNIFSPTQGFFHSATIEEAGVVSRAAGGFKLPYSEYVKVAFLVKHFFSSAENQSMVFGMKLQGGVAYLYNKDNPTPVPLPRRFFVGGSGSVRGWKDKQLSAFGNDFIGGNIVFEGSLENRLQVYPYERNFLFLNLKNVWMVTFLDYGNTWYRSSDVKANDIAAAVGFGIRYETFVGPFRFDVAWRLYDPKQPAGKQWLHEQSFFRNSFSLVHFGIGHAF
jgi:outer membrane protein insertion porin family